LLDYYDQSPAAARPALEAFAQRVTVRLNTTVESLVVHDGRVTGVRLSEDGGGLSRRPITPGVVVRWPAYAAADIVRDETPGARKRLSEVRYNPSSVMLVEYDRPVFSAR